MGAFPKGASERGGAAAAAKHREQCRQADALVLPVILELRGQGKSLREIAAALTAAGVPTRQGNSLWHARQVSRILSRDKASSITQQGSPETAAAPTSAAPPAARSTPAPAPPAAPRVPQTPGRLIPSLWP